LGIWPFLCLEGWKKILSSAASELKLALSVIQFQPNEKYFVIKLIESIVRFKNWQELKKEEHGI
jgi:hypothetical protein